MLSFNDKFTEILRNYPDVTTNRKRFVGLLRDYFPLKIKRTRLLINLHELRIAEEIAKADNLNDKFAYRYTKQLVEEYGVDEQNAAWGVRVWCLCYGGGILGIPCQINAVEDSFAYAVESDDDDFAESELPSAQPPNRRQGRIFIPCSAASDHCGYFICGIIEAPRCTHTHANIYAIIYNYIIRSSQIGEDSQPTFFKEMKTLFRIDYSAVFRLKTIILQLIKNNYITDSQVNFRYDGDVAELRCALLIINNYADLFCRLIGMPPCAPLKISDKSKAIIISGVETADKSGVFTEVNHIPCNSRELWYGQRINYKLAKSNIKDLEYLLSETSTLNSFRAFREGQFSALRKMMSADEHTVCTIPGGRGKSMLFYLATLLQPVPLFVITPTRELIDEQVENLRQVHGFDNAAVLESPADEVANSLLFLTYDTFGEIGEQGQVSYLLTRDTLCHCNWSRELSFEKIGDLAAGELDGESLANIERANTLRDSYGFDLLAFLAKLRGVEGSLDSERLSRIVGKTAKRDFLALCVAVAKVYPHCRDEVRFAIHKELGEHLESCGSAYSTLFDVIYLTCKKDFVYYGVLAQRLNPLFARSGTNV